MTDCDFTVSARVIGSDGTTERIDLNDRTAGYTVLDPAVMPDDEPRQARIKSARVHGSFAAGPALDDDGTIVLRVRIDGATWAQVQTRQEAMRTAMRADADRYIELEIEGVTRRWYTDAPVSTRFADLESTNLSRSAMTYELRFLVQPNPVVTIV